MRIPYNVAYTTFLVKSSEQALNKLAKIQLHNH